MVLYVSVLRQGIPSDDSFLVSVIIIVSVMAY